MKTICCLLKKLKIEPLFNPAVPPQGIHPKKMKTLTREGRYLPLRGHHSIIYDSQDMET